MTDGPFKTVIGSYPSDFNKLGLVAIREAVNDQLRMGIDLISDGQTRTDMVSYYAKSIDGFKVEALAASTEQIAGSTLVFGTEDEVFGGTFRGLKPE